jgi:hypothetical protein
MARYTCSFCISSPRDQILKLLHDTLEGCRLEVIYKSGDYIVAKETPGNVTFSQLVTVEILIDTPDRAADRTGLHFIIKNEELPLRQDNHCRQMSDLLSGSLNASGLLEPLSQVTG